MKRIIYIILILLPIFSIAQEQVSEHSIQVIANVKKNKIQLRWAPDSPLSWSLLNKYGYRIERCVVFKNGVPVNDSSSCKYLNNVAIQPYPLDEWEPLVMEMPSAAVAAQAIYGEKFEVTSESNLGDIMRHKNEEENKYSFAMFAATQSIKIAEFMGLTYIDMNIDSKNKYLYRVYSLVPDTLLEVKPGFVYVDASQVVPLPRPIDLVAYSKDKTVSITWPKDYFVDYFVAYNLERSDDGGNTFTRLNEVPMVMVENRNVKRDDKFIYFDSVPDYNKEYFYRVNGISFFGEESPFSDTVSVKTIEALKFAPKLNAPSLINKKNIVIDWEVPEHDATLIKGYNIYIAPKNNATYQKINMELLPDTFRSFGFEAVYPANYIRLGTVANDGEELLSASQFIQLDDDTPPSIPENFTGNIDSTGVVTLHWNPSPEIDVKAYNIYYSNTKNDEFSLLNNYHVRDTIYRYQTSINTLSKKIFFKVLAFDMHYNESPMSEILTLKRPDKIPPSPPVFSDIETNDTTIILKWKTSSSRDLKLHVLYRRDVNDNQYEVVYITDSIEKELSFVDNKALPGITYEYAIVAVDDSKNESQIESTIKGSIKKRITKEPLKLSYKLDRKNKQVKLNWEYKGSPIVKVLIYREQEDIPMRLIASETEKLEYIDKELTVNTKYIYKIRAILKNGKKTGYSNEVFVKY